MKQSTFFSRNALKIMIVVVFLFPIAMVGAILALKSNRNDVKEWLPSSFQETKDYQEFQKNFPHETFVLVSWEGCTLDDQRLGMFAEKVMLPAPSGKTPELHKYFDAVMTGPGTVDILRKSLSAISPEQAAARIRKQYAGQELEKDAEQLADAVEQRMHAHHDVRTPLLKLAGYVSNCALVEKLARIGTKPIDEPVVILHPTLAVTQQPVVNSYHLRRQMVGFFDSANRANRVGLTVHERLNAGDNRRRR